MITKPIRPQLSARSGLWSRQISKLDAKKDATEILSLLFDHVLPMDLFLAAEFAQLRTFTIPSISSLLHKTGEYEKDGFKRLVDTQVIMGRIIGLGPESEEGKKMADHLNQIHGFYTIANDDYLYVLSTFIFDPVLWIERYGWRELTPHEKEAIYHLYAGVGKAMNIQAIPPSFDDYWQWRVEYEAHNQRFAESNLHVTHGMVNSLQMLFPRWLRWTAYPLLGSLLDKRFREALGLPKPNPLFYAIVQSIMWLRAKISRHINIWEEASFADSPIVTGPVDSANSDPFQIGPARLIEQINRRELTEPR